MRPKFGEIVMAFDSFKKDLADSVLARVLPALAELPKEAIPTAVESNRYSDTLEQFRVSYDLPGGSSVTVTYWKRTEAKAGA